jgi:RNA polymerase sigma-70 factor (ECF subfamily)
MIDAARLAAPLEQGLRQLTDNERELLLLVAEEGLPVAEAGRALGIPAPAARMRLNRARRKLRPFTTNWRAAA